MWINPGEYGWSTIGGSTHTGMCYVLGIGTLVRVVSKGTLVRVVGIGTLVRVVS